MRLVALLCLISSSWAFAQPASSPNISTAPEWDVRSNLKALAADVRKVEPLLKKLNPQGWIAKGSPGAYVKQVQSALGSVQYLVAATVALDREPERLSTALDAFFKMERMELLLNSLKEGVRRWDEPAVADEFTVLLATNSVHRDRLRQHITELARVREEELQVVDREAQRCRAELSQRVIAPPKPEARKNRKQENR